MKSIREAIDREKQSIRVFLFQEYPRAMLLHAPEDIDELFLPVFSLPFERNELAQMFGNSGIKANVRESVPGRWTSVLTSAKREASAERGSLAKLREATEAALLRGSNVKEERDRAVVIARKHEVDEAIRLLKVKVGLAKSEGHTGRYMPVGEFRAMEQQLAAMKNESQALQSRLGQLRTEKHVANHGDSFSKRFMRAARAILSEDVFANIETAARVDELDNVESPDDDDPGHIPQPAAY